jgi:hypothetical protein
MDKGKGSSSSSGAGGIKNEWKVALESVDALLANLRLDVYDDSLIGEQTAEAYRTMFAFAGYNPKGILGSLMAKAAQGNMNKETFKGHILTIIAYGVWSGAKVNADKRAKLSQAAYNSIQEACTKLGVTQELKNNKKPRSDEPTIPRVMSVFVVWTAAMMKKTGREPIGWDDECDGLGVPKGICFPGGVALVPTDDEAMFAGWMIWALKFNRAVRVNEAKKQPAETLEAWWANTEKDVQKYAELAWMGDWVSDDARKNTIAQVNYE